MNTLNIEMIDVEGGTLSLNGNQSSISNFSIGKYPVTQAQWREVMGGNPSYFKDCDDCPVESVSWLDVQDFLKKINQQTGFKFRLPTEAEWEYAARGGNQSKDYLYAGSNDLDEVGWYWKNSGGKTHPVGSKKPNELGIYDMSGNVWEWCWDWYGDYLPGAKKDYAAPEEGDYRVIRGGSWFNDAEGCRAADRGYNTPTNRCLNVGFRLVEDL